MASQVFYRKWRPQTLAEVVGQEAVTKTLLNALGSSRISHAYLFCGPRGTGKTSTGRILAKAVNCLNNNKHEPCNNCSTCEAITQGKALDIIEIDAASNRGIDEIRELRERVNYAPSQALYKIYIIDEVHMLTKEASNALLKTLEEPPPHVIFILATTEAHKLLPTILSRCQRFDFRRLSQADIVSKLTHICQMEGINIEPESLRLLARSSTGSLRDAENLLEQLTTYYGAEIELKQTQALLGITGDWRARELTKHIINGDVSAGIRIINSVSSDGLDLKQFNRELVEYLRVLLLLKTSSGETVEQTAENIAELKELAKRASLTQILKAVKLFGQLELGFDSYSTLPLDLAMVDSALSSAEEQESRQPREVTTPSPELLQPEPSSAKPEPVSIPMPTTTTPITRAQPDGEIEQLKINWKQVVENAPPDTKKTSALAILRSAGVKPVAIENGTIVLTFRYPYHKEQIEKIENQRVTERIIGNFLGYPCRIRCILEENPLLKAALKIGAQITSVEEE
ncbi:DNA polymerase III subunit gamma/tau [Chloroflexota bacterium]